MDGLTFDEFQSKNVEEWGIVKAVRGILMRECANLYKSIKIGTLVNSPGNPRSKYLSRRKETKSERVPAPVSNWKTTRRSRRLTAMKSPNPDEL